MLRRFLSRMIEPSVKEWIREEILKQAAPDLTTRLSEVEAKQAKLAKRLSMAMGAISAATSQIVELRSHQNATLQAGQRATSAEAMVESVADGLNSVEEQLAELLEKVGASA